MPAIRLDMKRVEKPWGRRDLWPGFGDVPDDGPPVGEVWFQHPGKGAGEGTGREPELLIKYLFTADRLSVQVHPGDDDARARGHARGKSEAWQILRADPGATIALGTRAPMTRDALRAAAIDGSIARKLDWKPVAAGQFWYAPAGTVHAIGPGLVLVEIQQNVDLTYRLYDYGSGRTLHLEEGIAVSDPLPYAPSFDPYEQEAGRRILIAGGAFVAERWTRAASGLLGATPERPVWLVPLAGAGRLDGQPIGPGGVWLADSIVPLELAGGSDLLVAYPGAAVNGALLA